MPQRITPVEIPFPEAERLAHLVSIADDLKQAAYWCAKAVELGQGRRHDSRLVEALVTAAIVKYGRCFKGGIRPDLANDDLLPLSQQDRQKHEYFLNLRDKFVAHSINVFEESYVTAMAVVRDGVQLPIEAIGHAMSRILLSAGDAKELAPLVASVEALVKDMIAEERPRVLLHIQGQPLATIHALPMHTIGEMRRSDVSKSRPQRTGKSARRAKRK